MNSKMDRCGNFRLPAIFLMIFVLLGSGEIRGGFLYVLNDNNTASQIYGYRVNEQTGALTALTGFPISPGIGGNNSIVSERMVADPYNKRLYVINETDDTIAAYRVDPATGGLTAMPFSPIVLGTGTRNTIRVHPSGSPLITSTSTTSGIIQSFNITATTATPASGSPFAVPAGLSVFSSIFSQNGSFYYAGGNTGTAIAGFAVDPASGTLTALAGSPFDSGASNPLAYATDSSGRLFIVNSTDTAARVFSSANGILSPVTGNPFPSGLTQRRYGLVHPSQKFYIVAGNTGSNVGVYQISGEGAATTLTAVSGSPFATGGTTANNLAANQSGTFLYVGNRISRNVTTFSFNPSTGVLTSSGVQPSNTNGTTGALNGIAYMPDPNITPFDFDGDGRADQAVFRPSDQVWYLLGSQSGFSATQFGLSADKLTPADFDGDSQTDLAVFRDGTWYINRSSDNSVQFIQWGAAGDIPVPADFDGDGQADLTVFRPSNGNWYVRQSSNDQLFGLNWGISGDVPVIGDYDGDGTADFVVFRPSNGTWYILRSSDDQASVEQFGLNGDLPQSGDFNGDGSSDLAVFRPSDGTWYIAQPTGTPAQNFDAYPFGLATDTPVAADYDGDGRTDIAVYRDGLWYLLRSQQGFGTVQFGLAGDKPIPAVFGP